MRLLVSTEHHFWRDREGLVVPAPPAVVDYNFWRRYLEVFSEVVVLARVGPRVLREEATSMRADGPGVTFLPLPDYAGPWGYLRSLRSLSLGIREGVSACGAYILRVPGSVGSATWREIRREGKPFALEVVADPWDLLAPEAATSWARPVARYRWVRDLREMCRESCAISYVTREALQKRYPSGPRTWTTHVSSVELDNAIADQLQIEERIHRVRAVISGGGAGRNLIRIGFVGMFYQLYKGPDILLRAIAICRQRFPNLDVALVGDGKKLAPMRNLARQLGLADCVQFVGSLPPGEQIYRFLDDVDLFVLPSRQEGLPRAIIEAMARGCPCIGTTVGGVSELIPPEDLVPPNDVNAVAGKIVEVLSDPARMERTVRRNCEAAKQYLPEILSERRREFYRKVRDLAYQTGTAVARRA
jgi:glycosyltransferase involved in cell wall biosynthesis